MSPEDQTKLKADLCSKALLDQNVEVRHLETISLASSVLFSTAIASIAGFFASRWTGTERQIATIAGLALPLGLCASAIGLFIELRLQTVAGLIVSLRDEYARIVRVSERDLPKTTNARLVYEKSGSRNIQTMFPKLLTWGGFIMLLASVCTIAFISTSK